MELRLLGPVQVLADTGSVDLGTPRQRLVLALLALEVNMLVPVERLLDLCWPIDPPATARRVVQAHVSRLRAALTSASAESQISIIRQGGGYMLQCDRMQVDAHRFRALVDRARNMDDANSARLLSEALGLWRGPALADVATCDVRTRLCAGLGEARLAAIEDRIDAELRLGRHHVLLDELTSLVAEHPYRDRMTCQLALALYRAGRTAAALDACRTARQHRAEELGVDPGAELQRLELGILRADPALDLPDATFDVRPAPRVQVPTQLPADPVDFIGRAAELADMSRRLAGGTAPNKAPVNLITGTAGVGKTALAVHWAHRVAHHFGDGQLYVDLRGFDPSGSAMSSTDVLRTFLDALGVAAQNIPPEMDARVGLYRSLLAGRRMLVVLDNARDVAQVRALLPGAEGCLTLVTSRSQLTGLVAVDGAHPLILDLLTETEARQLLAHRIGPDRVEAEPDAVNEIITRCARLPLALAVVAARAVMHPDFALSALADELRRARGLDAFATDDPTSDVTAVFSWSYHALTPSAAQLFRLIGLHPGPDLTTAAAASLAGIAAAEVHLLLVDLTRANLLTEHKPDRYAFHDLLRTYAAGQAHALDSDAERRTAVERMLDHYLHTAHNATRLLIPTRDPIALTPPRTGVVIIGQSDLPQALAWLNTQRPTLLAIIDQAAASGFDTHTWQLAWTLTAFLDRQGYWHDRVAMHTTGLAAARRLGDREGQARMHQGIANAYARLGRLDDAHTHLRYALNLLDSLDDHNGQAIVHLNLAFVLERQGCGRRVLHHTQAAHNLYQIAGNRTGQARTLNEMGWQNALRGDYAPALTYCQQALSLLQELNDAYGQAGAWDSLGYIHHHSGNHQQAVACYRHSLDLLRDIGDCTHRAEVLARLGDTHHLAGDLNAAHDTWTNALTIFEQIDHPDAGQVRAKLHRLNHSQPPIPEHRADRRLT